MKRWLLVKIWKKKRNPNRKVDRVGKSTRRIKEPEFNYLSKKAALAKLKRSTQTVQRQSLLKYLRKNGFLEVPLEEVHDRLSKIRRSLSQMILMERNG